MLQKAFDDSPINEKEMEEGFNLEAHLSKLGLEVIDKCPPDGTLWIADEKGLLSIMEGLAEKGCFLGFQQVKEKQQRKESHGI